MLKLKLQSFDHLMRRANSLENTLMLGKHPWRQEEKGTAEDKMLRYHHWLNGHELEQTLGDGKGLGSLVCCSQWCHKQSDMTKQLNNNNKKGDKCTFNWPAVYSCFICPSYFRHAWWCDLKSVAGVYLWTNELTRSSRLLQLTWQSCLESMRQKENGLRMWCRVAV